MLRAFFVLYWCVCSALVLGASHVLEILSSNTIIVAPFIGVAMGACAFYGYILLINWLGDNNWS